MRVESRTYFPFPLSISAPLAVILRSRRSRRSGVCQPAAALGSGPRKTVVLNSVVVPEKDCPIGREVICESGKLEDEAPADPRHPKCAAEMLRFYEEVCARGSR